MARITVGNQNEIQRGKAMPNSSVFLFMLIIVEYAAFLTLRYLFRNVHGG